MDKLNNNITLLTIEKEKLEAKNKELSNKLSKKDKEIIAIITNNNKEKKNINEQNKIQTERLRNEVEDRRKMNEQFKGQITELQKKLFEMQNSDFVNDNNDNNNESINSKSKDATSFKINHSIDINILANKNKKFNNLNIKSEIDLFLEQIYRPRSTPRSSRGTPMTKKVTKKTSNEIKEDEEEESEDYYDDETDEEFNEKMEKLNQKNPNDSKEMKLYKKENRKMLYRLEDALSENQELKQKMIKIEEIVTKKQNELYNNLKTNFEILLGDFNLTNKNRNTLNYFLKLINCSEDEISNLLSKKQKGLLGFFK
jgi:hypothetical protein